MTQLSLLNNIKFLDLLLFRVSFSIVQRDQELIMLPRLAYKA